MGSSRSASSTAATSAGSDRRSAALTVPAPNRTSSGWAASGCTSRTHGNARSRTSGRSEASTVVRGPVTVRPSDNGTGREASSSATTPSTTSGISASYSVFHQRGSRWWPESSSASRARPMSWTSTAARAGAQRGVHSAGEISPGTMSASTSASSSVRPGKRDRTRRQQVSAAVGSGQPRRLRRSSSTASRSRWSASLRAKPGVGTRSSRWSAGSAATNDA